MEFLLAVSLLVIIPDVLYMFINTLIRYSLQAGGKVEIRIDLRLTCDEIPSNLDFVWWTDENFTLINYNNITWDQQTRANQLSD